MTNFIYTQASFLYQQANVVQSWSQSNAPGKLIIIVLVAFSVVAWGIMLSKWVELREGERSSERFLRTYRAEGNPISLYLKRSNFGGSHLHAIYSRSCKALGMQLSPAGADESELFIGDIGTKVYQLSAVQVEVVRNVSERNVADQALLLEKNIGLLATAVSTAPFLGLLGTVWGVMEAFSGMALTGAPTLSAVAPGISAALLTTVVALLVALPSAIGYNLLTNQIRRISVQMDNFAQEFTADIQHTYMSGE